MDLTFIVDSSGSVCPRDDRVTEVIDGEEHDTCNNWNLVRDFTSLVVDELTISNDPDRSVRVAAIRYANRATLLWDLNE